MTDLYLYGGLEAELYDHLDELAGFEDLHFYRWFIDAAPGEVLDLGCGTGRVMIPLLESGSRVVGLDSSERMLELCQQSLSGRGLGADLVQGDMRDFDLGEGRFGTILIPGFSIQMLLADEDVEACLTRCRRHLKEGGQLIVPTFMPWEMIWDGRGSCPMEERKAVELQEKEERLVAFQGWELDARSQRLKLSNRYERRSESGDLLSEEEKEMTIRWHMPHDFVQLLVSAGFGDVSLYGDFGFEPPEPESESVVYLARA